MIMNKICGIYKITNKINGMSYVGQSKDCYNRWNKHKVKGANGLVDQIINEYGVENFSFQILLECPPDMLDVWERDMINLHDTLYPKGYNYQGGGKCGFNICEETRRKHSESMKGKNTGPHTEEHNRKISESGKGKHTGPFTEEHRRNLSESLRGKKTGEKNPMYNHKHTEEARRKISEKRKGVPNPKYKWITPSGEIKEMSANTVSYWHKDWIKIEE